jgi:PAS domain S-box-containing protein
MLQQTLLGEALDHAPWAIFVFDEDRNYVAVNEAACELTGYTRKELLDQDVLRLSARPEATGRRLREAAQGRRISGRGFIRRKDGTTVPVSYRVGLTRVASAHFLVSVCWPTG